MSSAGRPEEAILDQPLNRQSGDDSASAANTPSIDEKKDLALATPDEKTELAVSNLDGEFSVQVEDPEVRDLYDGNQLPPIEGLPEEVNTFTFRAIIVGVILGAVVGASNIYLGLKTGFTFSPCLFGAIFGFAIIKPLSKLLPPLLGGGYFGPKENVTVQTAATAAGGLGIIFVSGIPAMYRLNLMDKNLNPLNDIGRLITFTLSCTFFGVFFSLPLRKYYILLLKLTFPTPTATAHTIRSLHSSGASGARDAKLKATCLGIAFLGAITLRVVSGYAPGLLWDFHIFWYLAAVGADYAARIDAWGWIIEFTPAFFGAGILSGINASYSFFGGAFLAWGVMGPLLVHTKQAVGIQDEDDPRIWSFFSMSSKDPVNAPSPRYWLLWPGVMLMVAYSFAEISLTVPSVYRGLRLVTRHIISKWRSQQVHDDGTVEEREEMLHDPAAPEDRVSTWQWVVGVVASIVVSIVVLHIQFDMNVGNIILSIILGFILSFMGVQALGATDVNPVSTSAKATQLIVGGATKGQGLYGDAALLQNLLAGNIAAAAAAQAGDMTSDLKTGHLLGAKPKHQFWAQCLGAVVSIFLSVGLFCLFTSAYPCILEPNNDSCAFGAPSIGAWVAVATAVTEKSLPISTACGVTAIMFGVLAFASVYIRHFFVPKKYQQYMPNWNSVGLAFVVPGCYYAIAMVAGSSTAWIWQWRAPKSFEMFGFALAAGLIAGEGMGGVVNALLAVLEVDGSKYGSAVGCPGYAFCG